MNFKTEKASYKVKQSKENPVEKQAIFENHHEAIIDRETWERVQELRKQRKRPNRYDEVGLFSGLLFCADCGSVMYQQRYQTDFFYFFISHEQTGRDCNGIQPTLPASRPSPCNTRLPPPCSPPSP